MEGIPQAQRVQHAARVGADLDARADLAVGAGAFMDGDAGAAPGQRQGSGQPTDAAADDDRLSS